MGRTACTEPQCLYKGALYLTVEVYLYSPYGPYGLYRASVPVQGCTLPFTFVSVRLNKYCLFSDKQKEMAYRKMGITSQHYYQSTLFHQLTRDSNKAAPYSAIQTHILTL